MAHGKCVCAWTKKKIVSLKSVSRLLLEALLGSINNKAGQQLSDDAAQKNRLDICKRYYRLRCRKLLQTGQWMCWWFFKSLIHNVDHVVIGWTFQVECMFAPRCINFQVFVNLSIGVIKSHHRLRDGRKLMEHSLMTAFFVQQARQTSTFMWTFS